MRLMRWSMGVALLTNTSLFSGGPGGGGGSGAGYLKLAVDLLRGEESENASFSTAYEQASETPYLLAGTAASLLLGTALLVAMVWHRLQKRSVSDKNQ